MSEVIATLSTTAVAESISFFIRETLRGDKPKSFSNSFFFEGNGEFEIFSSVSSFPFSSGTNNDGASSVPSVSLSKRRESTFSSDFHPDRSSDFNSNTPSCSLSALDGDEIIALEVLKGAHPRRERDKSGITSPLISFSSLFSSSFISSVPVISTRETFSANNSLFSPIKRVMRRAKSIFCNSAAP